MTGKQAPLLERIVRRILVEDITGCWLWQGAIQVKGYGVIGKTTLAGWRQQLVHVAAYEEMIGPIPEGFDVDHICHNADKECPGGPTCRHRRCVNPDHLEAVSHQENCQRGRGGKHLKDRTHCPRGHAYDESNTYIRSDGGRRCRQCSNEASRKYHVQKRQQKHL